MTEAWRRDVVSSSNARRLWLASVLLLASNCGRPTADPGVAPTAFVPCAVPQGDVGVVGRTLRWLTNASMTQPSRSGS